MNKLLLFFIIFITFTSCNKRSEKVTDKEPSKSLKIDSLDQKKEQNNEVESSKKGTSLESFVPIGFQIQYSAEGDLNNDNLKDAVLVLVRPDDKIGKRTVLILLKNADNTYRLDKKSETALGNEYADNDFKLYYSEEIKIENGKLLLHSFGSGGPSGNLFSDYQYFGNELQLIKINTYDVGAGSWLTLDYDLLKGELQEEVTNTMKEDMPSEVRTFKIKKEKYFFENDDPGEIIRKAYSEVPSNW
jgi:hypothetical protein